MPIAREKIENAMKAVESWEKRLSELQKMYECCGLSGHQNSISVSVDKVGSFPITEITRESGYSAVLVRGREMILLGVKKALAQMIDEAEQNVRLAKRHLAHVASL